MEAIPCTKAALQQAGRPYRYVRQLVKDLKNALQGRSATTTHLPIASASAVVVATTSLVLGLTNTWPGQV